MADAFPNDDAPAVMATPGPTGKAPIPAVSRGAVVAPARASLAHQNRIKTAVQVSGSGENGKRR